MENEPNKNQEENQNESTTSKPIKRKIEDRNIGKPHPKEMEDNSFKEDNTITFESILAFLRKK